MRLLLGYDFHYIHWRVLNKLILIILAASLAAGCTGEYLTTNQSKTTTNTETEDVKADSMLQSTSLHTNDNNQMLEVNIDPIENIQAGQIFQIHASLVSHADGELTIMHGADLFKYTLTDMEGSPIQQPDSVRYRNDIGYSTTLKVNEPYRENGEEHRSREYYEFIITDPGRYRIKATAHFRVQDVDGVHEVEIESKEMIVEVLPAT